MSRKKIIKIATLCMTFLMLAGTTPLRVDAKSNDYTVDSKSGSLMPIPAAYEVGSSIKNMGSYGFLKQPEDIFIDDADNIYVADTGNNRVLKLSRSGEVLLEIKKADGKDLNAPKGIYVDKDGSIWIADTGNLRIAVVEKDGSDRREYTKPNSALLAKNFTFDVEKLYVNKMGYIYALKGANLMRIDSNNNFQGYMGATNVGFNLTRFLVRTFGTKEQIEKTVQLKPTAYNNFVIADDSSIYGVLASGTSEQIRRLNTVGENTYVPQAFGYSITKDGESLPTAPVFSDVTVFQSGIVSVVDKGTGMIYQYDPDGNLLTSFGGIGDAKNLFKVPIGIASDSKERLYVLDYSAGAIKVFQPTGFISTVHQAIVYQRAGEYKKEEASWNKILKLDSNYSLAHKGIGKIEYKAGKYKESMEQYRLGNDKTGYSTSFSEYRHSVMRKHFGWVALAVVVVIFAAGKLFVTIKRRSDKWSHQIEMKGDME